MSRQTCTSHCTACDGHFHGDTAFDLHRRDSECQDPMTLVAGKGVHAGRAILVAWTEAGHCDFMAGCWEDGRRVRYQSPVVIYQQARTTGVAERVEGLESAAFAAKGVLRDVA